MLGLDLVGPELEGGVQGAEAGLEEVTEFLVVAATLLDLKTARLVPSGEVQDPEDLALLQARDMLFARLLQFRAFRQVAELFGELDRTARHAYPRTAGPDEEFLGLLPEVELGVDPDQFATIAAVAFRPRPVDEVGVGHIHAPVVSVPEQAGRVLELLKFHGEGRWVDFRDLITGCDDSLVVVATAALGGPVAAPWAPGLRSAAGLSRRRA